MMKLKKLREKTKVQKNIPVRLKEEFHGFSSTVICCGVKLRQCQYKHHLCESQRVRVLISDSHELYAQHQHVICFPATQYEIEKFHHKSNKNCCCVFVLALDQLEILRHTITLSHLIPQCLQKKQTNKQTLTYTSKNGSGKYSSQSEKPEAEGSSLEWPLNQQASETDRQTESALSADMLY